MKTIVEMIPLLLFFAAYKLFGLIPATGVLIIATVVAVAVTYITTRKVPIIPLVSAVILSIFGGLTLLQGDVFFIKIKPTLVNLVFAIVLLGGVWWRKKGLLKHLLGAALTMDEDAWRQFSVRWGIFFLFLAGLNEVVWRNFTTDMWVQFKVFGMLPLTIFFTLVHIPFIQRHAVQTIKVDNETN